MARVIAWRIHQVAYVENLKPLVVELLHRFHEPEVALLDEVQKLHSPADIAFRYRHYEAQVCLRKDLFCLLVALLHALCQLDLHLRRKQRDLADVFENLADVFEIHLDRVVEVALDDGVDVVLFCGHDGDVLRGKRLEHSFEVLRTRAEVLETRHYVVLGYAPVGASRLDDLVDFLFQKLLPVHVSS